LGLGREGEEYTGQELNFLMSKGAIVYHDIPYIYGNIDHVVIALDKIFAIVRSVSPASRLSDADVSKKYDFWLNPRKEEKLLGE